MLEKSLIPFLLWVLVLGKDTKRIQDSSYCQKPITIRQNRLQRAVIIRKEQVAKSWDTAEATKHKEGTETTPQERGRPCQGEANSPERGGSVSFKAGRLYNPGGTVD